MSASSGTKATDTLLQQGYYGANDFQPLSGCKKVVGYILLIIFSPLFLLITVLGLSVIKFSPHQAAAFKCFKLFEHYYKAPGKKLTVSSSGKDQYDVTVGQEFVDSKGKLNTCGGTGWSLRKSLEHTIDSHIRDGPHGAKVGQDTDVNKPIYHLNGSVYPYDPKFDELWTSPGRLCQWPAIYSWTPILGGSLNPCNGGLSQCADLADVPDVFGYIFLFQVTNPQYYDQDRIIRVGQSTVNCPEITPDNEGKIFARYGFRDTYYFGNLKTDGSEPDAYIFKGATLEDAQMKVLATYRIMKPQGP